MAEAIRTGATAIAVSPTNAACGASNGSVILGAVTGGTAPYLYNFDGAGFSATITYNNLAAGNYTLVVQDANGCTFTAPDVNISNTGGATAVVVTPTDAACGQSDGVITIGNVTGGVAPYTYDLNNTGVFTTPTVFSNLKAGDYLISVKDNNGCTFTAPKVTINSSGGPTVTITNPAPVCAPGTVDITAATVTAGSTTGLTYTYFSDAGANTVYTSPTAATNGTYYIVGTAAGGCASAPMPVVVTVRNGPTAIQVTPANAACGASNGSVTLGAVTGGATPYQYNFNGLGFSTTTTYNNLAAGSYSLIVQDANGCTFTAPDVQISNSGGATAVVVTPTDATCGQNDGSITIGNVTGGVAPYTYDLNNSGTFTGTTVYNNQAAGQYTVSVKDVNGCIFTAPAVTIGSTGGPTVTVTNPAPTCAPGTVDITAATVTAGSTTGLTYTYFSDAGANTVYISPTAATNGTYYIVGTTAGGCASAPMPVVVTVRNGPTAILVAPANAACGASNGSVTLGTVTGGTGPYLYFFNGGGFSSQVTYDNLAAGSYTLAVQDANGCIFNAPNVLISNTGGPSSVVITPADATCGQSNGSITIGNVTGGVAPYTYDLNNTGVFTGTTVYNNQAAGQYTVSVKDVNGCIFTAPAVTIGSTGGPTVTVTNPAPICAPGTADITAAAVTAGSTTGLTYTYFSDAGANTAYLTPTAATNGTYYIVGTTAAGCASAPMPVVVTVRTGATAIQVAKTNAGCGASNGIVLLGNVTGGVAPYQYNFNGLGFSSTVTYNNLAAGSYTLVVQDANGCTYNAPNISISNTGAATAVVVTPADATCGQSNGSITIGNVTGGVAPYTYQLNTGGYSNTTVYNNLASGQYTVSVKDVNGCIFTAPATTINSTTNSITPLFNAIANVCQNSTAPTLPLSSTNGIAGTWSPSAINTALTGQKDYIFTPTGNPCAAPVTITVNVNAAPASTTKVAVCPNQLPYTWNGQLYTEPGTFTQTFTRAAGCDSMATMILTVDQTMTDQRYPTITTTPNTATQLQARQLGSNFDYFWDPSVGLNSISIYNPIFSYNLETEYTISIVSDQGCKVVDTLLVKVNGSGPTGVASDLFVPNAWTPNGDGVNDRLFPLTENVVKLNFFRVFNRWGQLMFETSTIGDGWDGVFNGKPMMMDTYTWTAEAVGIDGKTFRRSGNAVLIR